MASENLEGIVQAALAAFYKRRLALFEKLNLKTILKRKNPYLFRAIGINKPQQLVNAVLAAYLSSSDEGIFGDAFFEPIAIAISGGRKSITGSVDLELDSEGTTRAYAVKSGLSVFNAQSLGRQIQAFEECRRRLPGRAFEAVVGYAYGTGSAPPTGRRNFRAVAGQAFWEEITGDPEAYKKIFEVLGQKADEHAETYQKAYRELADKLIAEFNAEFATTDGHINWDKLLTLNSGKRVSRPRKETTALKGKVATRPDST